MDEIILCVPEKTIQIRHLFFFAESLKVNPIVSKFVDAECQLSVLVGGHGSTNEDPVDQPWMTHLEYVRQRDSIEVFASCAE